MDNQIKQSGLQKINKTIEKYQQNVKIIFGGGDGTIASLLQEILNNQIDLKFCEIGTVPYGTGSDFSRTLGWGTQYPKRITMNYLRNLQRLVKQWVDAEVEDFDIWHVDFEVQEDGYFQEIQIINGEAVEKDLMSNDNFISKYHIRKFTRNFSNYFSLGVESKIGYKFEKKRSGSQFWNKFVYGIEGFKNLFTRCLTINELIKEIICENQKLIIKISEENDKQQQLTDNELIFENYAYLRIKKSLCTLLFLNIPFFMAGTNPWPFSKMFSASEYEILRKNINLSGDQLEDNSLQQSTNDNLIEMLGFSSILGLGSERLFNGQSNKILQDLGPFIINFKEEKEKKIETFFQVDGEYYKVVNPKQCVISKFQYNEDGKIKILRRKEQKKKLDCSSIL